MPDIVLIVWLILSSLVIVAMVSINILNFYNGEFDETFLATAATLLLVVICGWVWFGCAYKKANQKNFGLKMKLN